METVTSNQSSNIQENPGFYAIIPATVRYDNTLPQGAKLLYGEISALANKTGSCWAKNSYFAGLYDTTERTIIYWINRLRDGGHITVRFEYFSDSKKIKNRFISLPYPAINKVLTEPKNTLDTPDITESESQEAPDLVVKNFSPLDDLVVKKSSPPGGEKNFLGINTLINITSSSSSDPPDKNQNFEEEAYFSEIPEEKGNHDPPGLPETVQSASRPTESSLDKFFNPAELKSMLKKLNPCLIFDAGFYLRAHDFMISNGLDPGYVPWMYNFCLNKNPKDITGYFYKVFFEPRCIELYFAYLEALKPPPDKSFLCPVCGTEHGFYDDCPICNLKKDDRNSQFSIDKHKKLFSMSPEKRKAFEDELNDLFQNNIFSKDFKEIILKQKIIEEKYGLYYTA